VPSSGGARATKGFYTARLQTLIESWIALAGRERERLGKPAYRSPVVVIEPPVDFSAANLISPRFDGIVRDERQLATREGKPLPRVCFDITSGTAAVSAAAAVASLRENVFFSYVSEASHASGDQPGADDWQVVVSDFVPVRYSPIEAG
jgi:hypothetical protein